MAIRRNVMHAETIASLEEITASEWDDLASRTSLYQSYGWLKSILDASAADARYIVVRNARKEMIGALPVYFVHNEINHLYEVERVFDGLLSEPQREVLVAGARRGYHNELIISPRLSSKQSLRVAEALLDAVLDVCSYSGHEHAIMWYLTSSSVKVLREIDNSIEPIVTSMECRLRLPGFGMADYIAAFGSRKSWIRKEISVFANAGYEVKLEKLSSVWKELGPLMNNVERRYGNEYSDDAMTEVVRRQAVVLGDVGVVCTCRAEGRLIAFSLFIPWGDAVFVRMVGFDYERLTGAFEYFNMLCYEPIRYAYAHGIPTVHLGVEGYHAKVLRRATLELLWTVVLPQAHWEPNADLDAWNAAKMAGWRKDFRDFPHAFADPAWAMFDGCSSLS